MGQRLSKRVLHICISVLILVLISFVVGMLILKYQVEGETNLPFCISKIIVVSTSEGIDIEGEHKWNFNIDQNNDIYIYIEKNSEYNKVESIKNIQIENFQINRLSNLGKENIYRPQNIGTTMLKNSEEYKIDKLQYEGDIESDIKNLKISNQGGIVLFRYANQNIGTYFSDTEEEIKHEELLKKSKIKQDDLTATITFDMIINLNSRKKFKATITLNTPSGNIVEEGTTSTEITDLKDVIFKRI